MINSAPHDAVDTMSALWCASSLGKDMTVCIAAICRKAPAIIIASDRMISMPGSGFSADGMLNKDQFVCTGWVAQLAGDISQATAILKNPAMKVKFGLEGNESFDHVQALFVESYRRQRRSRIEASTLSPFGIGLDQFMHSGRAMFNERDHELLVQQIKQGDLGAELLVSGFDSQKEPHIFGVCDPGTSTDYTKIGFWSIGSGTHAALGVMFANKYDASEDLGLCIYKVLAAKFAAEAAEGVGRDTVLYILNPIGPIPLWLTAEEIGEIRERYDALKRVPDGIEAQIKGYMHACGETLNRFFSEEIKPAAASKILSAASEEAGNTS